jgi:hypothetical protein
MGLESTIPPPPPDPRVVEAANVIEALNDARALVSEIVDVLGSTLRTPSANWVCKRIIAAATAALDELRTPAAFTSSREIRLAICEAAFCWRGAFTDLVPMAAAFQINGRTVH